MVLATALFGMAGTARAADGDLFVDSCIAREAFAGCPAGLPANPIGIASSPDGRQLYAGVGVAGAFTGLQIFDVDDRTGAVTARPGPRGCFVAPAQAVNCTKLDALTGQDVAFDIAMSPDGANLYMATLAGAVLDFFRSGETGELAYLNCVGTGGGCKPLSAGQDVRSVAVSPDSRNVYIRGMNGLAVLDRNPSTLGIEQKPGFDGCFSEGAPANCTDVDGLADVGYKIAVAPDGQQVYVTTSNPGGVTTFNRESDGKLRYIQGTCISADGASGASPQRCQNGGPALTTAYVLTMSPDGRAVYVAGLSGMTSYFRDEHGALTRTGCYGATAGCTPVPGGLANVLDVAVTPGNDEVIAAGTVSQSVVSFRRDSVGALTPRPGNRGCISTTGSGGVCQALEQVSTDWMRLAMDPRHYRFFVTSRTGMLATVTRDYAPRCDSFEIETPLNRPSRSRSSAATRTATRSLFRRASTRPRASWARSAGAACSTTRSAASPARTSSRTARSRRAAAWAASTPRSGSTS